MTALLELRELDVGYDSLVVARGIDLSVRAGEVVAILGPNGAGKTSLLLTMAGFLPALAGTMEIDGAPIKRRSPQRMNELGVVLVPDSRALFTQLTTTENLRLASRSRGPSIDDVLGLFPALTHRAKVRAGQLSGGEQQMLALARSLVQGPRVLLIDEMSMGLAPVIVEQLEPIVRRVAEETGAAVVIVEQHVRLALDVADRAVVLVHGDLVLEDSAERLKANPLALEEAYLGRSESTPSEPQSLTEIVK